MKILASLCLILALAGCSSVKVADYADTSPKLDLRTFFDGKLKAYGMIQGYRGQLMRRFTATIDASWEGNVGTLDEVFVFDDGETTTRLWTLIDDGNGNITGTAGDVVGEATGGVAGAAFNWEYVLSIPYKGDIIDVKIDDWLYLVTEDRMLNRSIMKKFGFKVGEITLVIEK